MTRSLICVVWVLFLATGSSGSLGLAGFTGFPGSAEAQVTRWVGTTGDWGAAENWSDGEPTAGVDAEIRLAGAPTVTQSGETCRNLTTAIELANTLWVTSGSLTVAERLHVSFGPSGIVNQSGGTVTATEVWIGNTDAAGSYLLLGGTLNAGTVRAGLSALAGNAPGALTISVANPTCTIADSLIIGPAGSCAFGAGMLTVGDAPGDGVWVEGAFTFSGAPTSSLRGLHFSEQATFSVAVFGTGVGTITVNGPVTLDGQLLITDGGALDGTYEVIAGESIQGAFDSQFLPANWSWRVEGNTVLLEKGMVPAQRATWGGVKQRFQ